MVLFEAVIEGPTLERPALPHLVHSKGVLSFGFVAMLAKDVVMPNLLEN